MIDSVNINGKDMPVIFSFSAIALFMDKKNLKANQVTEALSDIKLSDIPLLAWCALKKGHDKVGKEFTHTIMEVEGWIDDEPSLAADIINTFNKAQGGGGKGGDKKKVTRKR
jgi:hypothetical protein